MTCEYILDQSYLLFVQGTEIRWRTSLEFRVIPNFFVWVRQFVYFVNVQIKHLRIDVAVARKHGFVEVQLVLFVVSLKPLRESEIVVNHLFTGAFECANGFLVSSVFLLVIVVLSFGNAEIHAIHA